MKKSEILFLYETSYNIPNGDPFTGEQRYDEETKKILVSDVRIKRYVRTYLEDNGYSIYVSGKNGNQTAKAALEKIAKESEATDIADILKTQMDVRLFGGISTLDTTIKNKNNKNCTNGHIQYTGPVQFSLLNPSLNRVNMRIHQNTSHFISKDNKSQGAIGTTTVVPYSVMQIHGWINPKVAETTGMTDNDKNLMYKGLWYGTSGDGSSFSRSKIGQDSLLLIELVYSDKKKKIYGVDRLISIKPKDGKKEEQLRYLDDFVFDFSKLINEVNKDSSAIAKIRYYTEVESIETILKTIVENKREVISL